MAELITRTAYLAHSLPDQKTAHRAYYAQFVTPAHFSRLKSLADQIKCSQDPYFNDIELSAWDRLAVPIPAGSASIMRECGDYPTLAGAVCILKEAARQIREGSYNG
jgi:hypothetical protein